jgi:biotin transport system substrate-specific component
MNAMTGTATLPGLTRSLATAPLWAKAVAIVAGTALIALSAHVKVPMVPVPMTMQTYVILIIGALYGSRLGLVTLLAYLAEGAAGLPVFANGGGAHLLIGPTGGYLIGFPLVAFLAGWFMERGFGRSLVLSFVAFTIAHAATFVFGVAWLAAGIGMGWEKAIAVGLTPFLIGSVVKTALAVATYEAAVRVPSKR